jgi:large subunit ribosomal protein L29
MPRRIEKMRDMKPAELQVQERELAEQIFRLRFQMSSGQAEGLKKLREARKDLARVKTLLRQQEIAERKVSAGKGK